MCVCLSLSFYLSVRLSVLSYQMMMHMALMGNLCMKRLSIIQSHVYMYVCVCVCVRAAPLIPKPQSAFSVSRSESPLD